MPRSPADRPALQTFSAARLRNSNALALLLLAAYVFAAYVFMAQAITIQRTTEAFVRLANDQRLLSQRAGLLASVYARSTGTTRVQYAAELLRVLDQFDATHQAIIRGDAGVSRPVAPSPAVRDIYYGRPVYLDRQVRQFSAHARALLRESPRQRAAANADLAYVVGAAQRMLLAGLDILADQYTYESDRRVNQLQLFETVVLVLALVTLLLEALFIFRPLELDLRRAAAKLRHMAVHDALTGLPNRRLLYDRAAIALAHARRAGSTLAVLFLDFDGFKAINDTEGHRVGDLLLQHATRRLHACLRDGDTMARMDGDEFVFLLPETNGVASEVAQRLIRVLAQPMRIEGHDLRVTCSIGISTFPADGTDIDTLIKCADIAMYRAKELGRNTYQSYGRLDPRRKAERERHTAVPVA